ncbi:MAG: putative porin [Planctomycetota bacterium]|jgi:hypothetical protein
MKGIVSSAMVAAFALVGLISMARADELSDLKRQVETQSKELSQLQQRIAELEAREKESKGLPESMKWIERIMISGDLRYRHDHTDVEAERDGRAKWSNGADRQRIRARLKFQAMINDEWDTIFGIASGTTKNPSSINQDLEDAFSSKDLWLDLAYFDWHPAAKQGLNVLGGKMKSPFYRAGGNELIWSSYLNPEGLAARYVTQVSDVDRLHLSGGGFWVDESTLDVDTSLWGAQAYISHTIVNPDYVLAGAGYYDYGNIEGQEALSNTWLPQRPPTSLFFGNTSSEPNGVYVNDYDIFEVFGEYGFEHGTMPLALFGSWVLNTAARTDGDTGWLAGIRFNRIKGPGSWLFIYDYRELEADAAIGGFTDPDFVAGRTDSRGHRFAFKYQITKGLLTAVTYYHAADVSRGDPELDFRRLMVDLVLKF